MQKQKKKILFFIKSLTGGGAERVTTAISNYFCDSGYNVTMVTMRGQEYDCYELNTRVKRICIGLTGEECRMGKIRGTFLRIKALRKVIKIERPDVVVGMMTTNAVITLLAAVMLPVRVVISERNYPGQKKNGIQWELMRKFFYRFADCIVVQTPGIARWIKENTGAGNVKIIPNAAVVPHPSGDRAVYPSDVVGPDERLILAAGRLHKQKGFDLLIKAFSAICAGHPSWKLVILGEESKKNGERGTICTLISRTGCPGRVLMPGRVGNISDWYKRADIFVLSSRYEGFPNTLLEAMATGCACVAFDCQCGPDEIIENGVNGLLVPAEDEAALSEALDSLISKPFLRRKLGVKATEVADRYSERQIFRLWSKVLFPD